MARLDPKTHSSHSLRRTKAALVYDATGNVVAVQRLLGQSSITATTRYLGVDERAALTLASRIVL